MENFAETLMMANYYKIHTHTHIWAGISFPAASENFRMQTKLIYILKSIRLQKLV